LGARGSVPDSSASRFPRMPGSISEPPTRDRSASRREQPQVERFIGSIEINEFVGPQDDARVALPGLGPAELLADLREERLRFPALPGRRRPAERQLPRAVQ